MLRALAIPLFPLLLHAVCHAEGTVTKGPAPAWVVAQESRFEEAGEDEDGSEHYLLIDLQRHAEEKSTYESFAIRILSEAGVEDHSQLSVDFQPTYQSVAWHHLDVIRGGARQDRLAAAEFELIRREEGLESQLYNGMITAHVILKDIRPGDIISYSFTTSGENPVLAGRIHSRCNMGFSVPVGRIHRALTWDPGVRTMAWKLRGLSAKAREENLPGGLRRISYDLENPAKIVAEKNTPAWFSNYPDLEHSDYRSWRDFGAWAEGIYTTGEALPPELVKVCKGMREEGGTPQEQALRVLRWSQANIRYLGSFFGEHTHAPYPLEEICSRRFGDCKDKGMLTVAMLRELGFDAAPALVHTDYRAAIADSLPGHAAFDHLIVHLRLEGKEYWLDPTRTFQRGSLDGLYSPDYGYAFVIREGAEALTAAQPSGFTEAAIDVHETFTIVDDEGNGTLSVRTVSSGANADGFRRTLATDGRAELEKDYRDYYAQDYPGLEIADPLTVEDDAETNRITTVESYRLKDFFSEPETHGGPANGAVYARVVSGYLDAPDPMERKHPYRISHPVRRNQTIDLTLPRDWDIAPEKFTAPLAAADYRHLVEKEGRTLRITHIYESRAGHVAPDEFAAYTKAMKEANDRLYYVFDYPVGNKTVAGGDGRTLVKSRVLLAVFTAIGLILGVIASIALYFWDPPARTVTLPAPEGLGGWLVLPTIGCFVLPFYTLTIIISFFTNIGEDNVNLFSDSEEQGMWRIYYCTSVLIEGILFSLCILQLVLMLKRRTSFPLFFVGLSVANFGSLLLGYALQSTVDAVGSPAESGGEVAGVLLRLAIWCTYMLVSQRVRRTFVNRRRNPLPVQPPPLPIPAGA